MNLHGSVSMISFPFQALTRVAKRSLGTAAAAPQMVYPAYVTDAPATEVSATSNGIRVASEVSIFLGTIQFSSTGLTLHCVYYWLILTFLYCLIDCTR